MDIYTVYIQYIIDIDYAHIIYNLLEIDIYVKYYKHTYTIRVYIQYIYI